MKRISVLLIVVAVFSLTGVSPTFAQENTETINENKDVLEPITPEQIVTYGAGEWDAWPFNPDEKLVTPGYYRTFNTVSSGGGDYKVEVNFNGTGTEYLQLTLWDDDGDTYEKIDTVELKVGQSHVFDVREAVDGDNNKAELFVNVETVPDGYASHKGYVRLSYWD